MEILRTRNGKFVNSVSAFSSRITFFRKSKSGNWKSRICLRKSKETRWIGFSRHKKMIGDIQVREIKLNSKPKNLRNLDKS